LTTHTPPKSWLAIVMALVFFVAAGLSGWEAGVQPMSRLLIDWVRAKNFDSVEVNVLELKLVKAPQGINTIVLRYEYRYRMNIYESDRLGLPEGFQDNLTDWQEESYQRLMGMQNRGEPVKAWVNPRRPGESMIDRDMRWLLLLAKLPFALLLPLVSIGALWSSVHMIARKITYKGQLSG
jgi:hypothetical protein